MLEMKRDLHIQNSEKKKKKIDCIYSDQIGFIKYQ